MQARIHSRPSLTNLLLSLLIAMGAGGCATPYGAASVALINSPNLPQCKAAPGEILYSPEPETVKLYWRGSEVFSCRTFR